MDGPVMMSERNRKLPKSPFSDSKESTVQIRNVRIADKPPTTGEDACAGHERYGNVTLVTLRLQSYTGSGAG